MNFGTSKSIVLDLYHNRYVAAEVAQYDINSRELIITITNKGKFYQIENGIIVRLKYLKSDGKKVFNDCEVLEDGTVKVVFTDQMTIASGRCDAELMLLESANENVLHTMHFVINVIGSVFPNEEIESSNEFIALSDALIRVERYEEQLIDLNNLVTDNENVRQTNEQVRIDAEVQRNTDENIRKENELERIANEETRNLAETNRQENEKIRQDNENIRIENEEIRKAGYKEMQETVAKAEENAKIYADNKEVVSTSEPTSQVAGDFWMLAY